MTISIPTREPSDYKYTVRQSDWIGGRNRLVYQSPNLATEPRFWDSFNVTTAKEGEVELAPLFERVQTDASDKKPLLAKFNGFVYRLEGVATPAVQKSSDGSTWSSVTMGPTLAITGWTTWRNQLIVAAGTDTVHRLSTADAWSTYAAPVSGTVAEMVGVAADDKLLAWVTGKGLYSTPDGTTWTRVWPTVDPDEPNCSFIDGSTGAVLLATTDGNGSSLHEYFAAEGAATQASVVTWMEEDNLFFYRARYYYGAAYIGAKKGTGSGANTVGQGKLIRKERGAAPLEVQEFGDGIRGATPTLDFGIRGLVNTGQHLWVGVPTSAPSISGTVGMPSVYRYEIDDLGLENVAPDSVVATSPGNIADKVYDASEINGEVLITTSTGTWKRSKTKKASQGYLDSSIYDLRAPDHVKIWRFYELLIEDASPTESVTVQYRTGTLSGAWLGNLVAVHGEKVDFPDDNASLGKYRLHSRQIQIRMVLARGATETLTPRVTSLAVDAAQIRPVGD